MKMVMKIFMQWLLLITVTLVNSKKTVADVGEEQDTEGLFSPFSRCHVGTITPGIFFVLLILISKFSHTLK